MPSKALSRSLANSPPIKRSARIGFSAGRYIAMPYYALPGQPGIGFKQGVDDGSELRILRFGISDRFRAFQLYAYRKIIATLPALVARFPCVPGALVKRDILHTTPIAFNQHMRRHRELVYLVKIRMFGRIELIAKKLVYKTIAEFARWQADAMYHQQGNIRRIWTLITVGSRGFGNAGQPMLVYIHKI